MPTLETKHLTLRPMTLADADSYERNFVDYEVIRFLSDGVPWPYPKGGVETFFRDCILPAQGVDRWTWGMVLKDQAFKTEPDEVVGAVDLWRKGCPEHRGFWLARRFWGHGLMSEATEPVTAYAFEHLGFERLVFSNALGNMASRRVKEKAGARLMDCRPSKFVDPAFVEAETWELTREDWLARYAPGD